MGRLVLHLFGYPKLKVAGRPVNLKSRKATALLAYMAVTGKRHSRQALAQLFWPDYPGSNALGNLRRTLFLLRSNLPARVLSIDRLQAGFNDNADCWCDVLDFRGLLGQTKRHSHSPDGYCAECVGHLERMIDLFHDDFLAGFSLSDSPEFDGWQSVEVEILRQERASALEQIAVAGVAQGDFATAAQCWQRILEHYPLHETANRRLMTLLAWQGDRGGALRQFEDYAARMQDELSARPSAQIVNLYQQIRAGFTPPSPPDGILNPSSHPVHPTEYASLAPTHLPAAPEAEAHIALGPLQHTKLTYLFGVIDRDGDGRITWQDFERYLSIASAFYTLPQESPAVQKARNDLIFWWQGFVKAESRISKADVEDEPAAVTLAGWLEFWSALTATIAAEAAEGGRTFLQRIDESVRVTFLLHDRDQDGLLTAEDYAHWMAAWGIESSAASGFRRLDQDRDGFLSLAEAVAHIREFYFTNDPEAAGNYFYGPLWNVAG